MAGYTNFNDNSPKNGRRGRGRDLDTNSRNGRNDTNANGYNSSYHIGSANSTPVSELTSAIESIEKMNKKLERSLAKIGTTADNSEFRDRMHEDQNETTAKVKDLMTRIAGAKTTLDRPSYTRISIAFDREFKRFQKLQSQMDGKQAQVIQKVAKKSGLTSDPSLLSSASSTPSYGTQQPASPPMMDDQIQFLEYDQEEIQRRTKEIRLIESEVSEVAEMYRDMHLLVNEQQESIDMIDQHVTSTKDKVENAAQQLTDAEDYQKKARKRKCCLLFVGLTVLGVFVLIMVLMNAK